MKSFIQRSLPSNYFVLNKLCALIENEAAGLYLQDCLSLNKNEFVLRFRYKEERYLLEAYLGEVESFIFFPDQVSTPKQLKNPFPELENQKLVKVSAHPNDRSFSMIFEDYSLFFKLYGRNANIILFRKNKIISLLKNQFHNDWALTSFNDFGLKNTIPNFKEFEKLQAEIGAEKAVSKLFPAFNQNFFNYLEQQNWKTKQSIEQWEIVLQLLSYLELPDFYIIKTAKKKDKNDAGIILCLFNFGEEDEVLLCTKDVKEALNTFAREYLSANNFQLRKNKIIDNLYSKSEKLKAGLNSSQTHLQHLEEDKNYRKQADILMANLHKLPSGAGEVELFDFYLDKAIIIKLKKNISPQKWAEKLYQKSKNQEIEKEKVLEKILSLKDALQKTLKEIEKITNITSNKELRNYQKAEKNQLSNENNALHPFKHFVFEGHEIFVGKSAKNNDELTLKFARKDDIWLHARGVSGSHVIIRKKGKNPVPVSVIRKAAQLAAYYSKGKNASLCPVIYTPKKYVRKPKGADPGAVVIEREEVIMAEPSSFET